MRPKITGSRVKTARPDRARWKEGEKGSLTRPDVKDSKTVPENGDKDDRHYGYDGDDNDGSMNSTRSQLIKVYSQSMNLLVIELVELGLNLLLTQPQLFESLVDHFQLEGLLDLLKISCPAAHNFIFKGLN